jgi:hypothetical protein
MSARRSQISPELMEALQMSKYLIKQGRGLDFTSTYNLDIELDHLETLSAARAVIPEDMDSFKEKLKSHVNDGDDSDHDDDEGSEENFDNDENEDAGDTS